MKFFTSFLFSLLLFSIANAQESAQTGIDKADEKPKYDVSFNIKPLVYHIYRFTETTKVKRVFEDETINEYEKSVTHWFTVFAPDPKNEEGFLLIEIKTDSMKYDLNAANMKVSYNTTNYDMDMPLNYMDFFTDYIQYGQSFNFLYSPYGDVARTYGEKLEAEKRDYSKTHDLVKRSQILYALSEEKLKSSFDVPKSIYPPFEVTKDTSWESESQFFVCGVPLNGKLINTFDGYSKNEYHISTKIDSLTLNSPIDNVILPDLDKNSKITSAVATGELKADLNTGGNINYLRVNLKALLKGELGNYKFNQVVETTQTCDLLGKFEY